MKTGFKDALKHLKLEDGIEGVERLDPSNEISEVFLNPLPKHLYIVVECLITSKLGSLLSPPQFSPVTCTAVFSHADNAPPSIGI
jgi:hypothetical protein